MSGTCAFAPLTSCSGAGQIRLLGAVQDADDAQDNVMLDGTEVNLPAEDIYQVQDASGRVLGHSPNWTGPDTGHADRKNRQTAQSLGPTASTIGHCESRASESSIPAIKAAVSLAA